jgi:hypothetical protein
MKWTQPEPTWWNEQELEARAQLMQASGKHPGKDRIAMVIPPHHHQHTYCVYVCMYVHKNIITHTFHTAQHATHMRVCVCIYIYTCTCTCTCTHVDSPLPIPSTTLLQTAFLSASFLVLYVPFLFPLRVFLTHVLYSFVLPSKRLLW